MEGKFNEFLYQNKILPLENNLWKKITVDHSSAGNLREFKNKILKEDLVGYISGIYVYTSLRGEVYYVGQGKLKSRIIKKYVQSTMDYSIDVPINKLPSSRYFFFRNKREKMNVYVMNVDGRHEQLAIEAMLTTVLKPSYVEFLEQYNTSKKDGRLMDFLKGILVNE